MIFAAIDWAEQRHLLIVLDGEGRILEREWIDHESHHLAHLDWLLTRHQPLQQVHVAIELHDGLLLDRLLRLGVKVYGINPKSAERARDRFSPAGVKDDERDAWSLAEFLRTSFQHLRPVRADSDTTIALREWVALREDLVQERTVQLQRLRDHLVRWHPHALRCLGDLNRHWALDLLETFPTADALAGVDQTQLADWARGRRLRACTLDRLASAAASKSPTTRSARNAAHAAEVRHRLQTIRSLNARLEEVDQNLAQLLANHPDAIIFRSLPRCGTATAAALLAGFGEDRGRWSGYEQLAGRWGLAPVTIQSGKHRSVRHRRACDTTLRQAWLWLAFNTINQPGCWARQEYQAKRRAGSKHYTALRGIAKKWVKIAYRCWQTSTPYQESLHQQRRAQRIAPKVEK